MKKFYFVYVFLFLSILQAQEKRLQFSGGGDLGFSKVKLNGQNLNLSTNGSFFLVNYRLKYLIVESGLEYFKTQGNLEVSGKSEFLENKYLSIPIGVNAKLGMKKNPDNTKPRFSALIAAGIYTNYLMKSVVEGVSSETDLGWNFGAYTKFGIHIQASDLLSLGVGMKALQDFSDIERNGISIKLERRNTIYLNFGIHF